MSTSDTCPDRGAPRRANLRASAASALLAAVAVAGAVPAPVSARVVAPPPKTTGIAPGCPPVAGLDPARYAADVDDALRELGVGAGGGRHFRLAVCPVRGLVRPRLRDYAFGGHDADDRVAGVGARLALDAPAYSPAALADWIRTVAVPHFERTSAAHLRLRAATGRNLRIAPRPPPDGTSPDAAAEFESYAQALAALVARVEPLPAAVRRRGTYGPGPHDDLHYDAAGFGTDPRALRPIEQAPATLAALPSDGRPLLGDSGWTWGPRGTLDTLAATTIGALRLEHAAAGARVICVRFSNGVPVGRFERFVATATRPDGRVELLATRRHDACTTLGLDGPVVALEILWVVPADRLERNRRR